MIPLTGWSPETAAAARESGHATAAYMLGCGFGGLSVIPDGQTRGRVHAPMPAEAVLAGMGGDALRGVLEDQLAVRAAGVLAEAVWHARQPDAPGEQDGAAVKGAGSGGESAALLAAGAAVLTGETPEAAAGRIAERVRGWVLPGTGTETSLDVRYSAAPDRFWPLAGALARELAAAGELTGRQARQILRAADPLYNHGRTHSDQPRR